MRIDEIRIKSRIRKDMGNIQELADSIDALGLLQPIVVDQNNNLIIGMRRLAAYQLLGLDDIPTKIIVIETEDEDNE